MNKPDTPISLEKDSYEILDHLGEGAYGIVWRARRVSDGEIVALKTAQTHGEKTRYSERELREIIKSLKWEIKILRRIASEKPGEQHILPLLDSGVHNGKPVMVLPLCAHSLNDIYRKCGRGSFPFDGITLLDWIRQIALGLMKLHSIRADDSPFMKNNDQTDSDALWNVEFEWDGGTVHRDLKPDNILIKNGKLYICDFGTVKTLRHEHTMTLVRCTPDWAAPELVIPAEVSADKRGRKNYKYKLTPSADLYSLGLIIHALIIGSFPDAQTTILDQITANGKPLLGAEEYFGTVGGLTEQERNTLQSRIRRLIAPDQTLVQQEFFALPDTEAVIEGIARLTESLLSPRAEDRPSAQAVEEEARRLGDFLAPVLSAFEIRVPGKAVPGESCTVAVTARGRGLPGNGKWLHCAVSGKPVHNAFRKAGKNAWKLTLPGFEKPGEYEIQVFALVGREKIADRKMLRISATPEQLWAQKLYAEALIRSPHRGDWLDFLEKGAKGEAGRREYMGILEKVRDAYEEKYTDIEYRYWRAMRELENIAAVNSLGMKFVYIPPGTFMMGSPKGEKNRDSDEVLHKVTLTKGFYMQTTQVTQAQWKAVTGKNPSHFEGDNCPVEEVSWNDVKVFIKKLNKRGEGTYRLPTEAEWEYSCRAGTNTAYCFGDDPKELSRYAWYDGNSKGRTHPVGKLRPNAWGLYDMHGNVWEWCEDWYGDYPSGDATDPTGPDTGSDRVKRGGGWYDDAGNCRSAYRNNNSPGERHGYLGLRLALSPGQQVR
ncbi:SUMF1/EgtB/PvdO family nonheme iron enzyme [Desulfococcaceae bacterium HSG8]|nr:SUMF1/EgtB/PvdO family nonheme iron enzyme [Desulfococcaceae bacterium HSG8]